MRRFGFPSTLVILVGWVGLAHAGHVTQYWDIDDQWGSTGKKVVHLFVFSGGLTIPDNAVSGQLQVDVFSPNSTFTKSVPPSSASLHVIGNSFRGTGSNSGGLGSSYWKITKTVTAIAKKSTLCHVGASGKMPGSCYASFYVATQAHCTGPGCTAAAPGTWPVGASSTHTQMWKAVSVHLGAATISHTANSKHYLKSWQATFTPPSSHLASSEQGYHKFHLGAKLTKVHTAGSATLPGT